MARITLTEASRVTGAARSTLYRAIQEGRLTREPDGTVDTAELLRAGFAFQHATSDTTSHDDVTIHDATPGTHGEDAPAILYLERLVATLERELDAAKTREAQLLEREAALLALVRAQQEAQQRVLEQGPPPQGFWARMVASWRRPLFFRNHAALTWCADTRLWENEERSSMVQAGKLSARWRYTTCKRRNRVCCR